MLGENKADEILKYQRRVPNSDKHQRPSFLRKQLTAESQQLISQKALSQVFDRVPNRPLSMTHSRLLKVLNNNSNLENRKVKA